MLSFKGNKRKNFIKYSQLYKYFLKQFKNKNKLFKAEIKIPGFSLMD